MFCGCETSRVMKMRDVFTSVMRSLIFFSATLSGLRQAAFSRVFGAGGWVKKKNPVQRSSERYTRFWFYSCCKGRDGVKRLGLLLLDHMDVSVVRDRHIGVAEQFTHSFDLYAIRK